MGDEPWIRIRHFVALDVNKETVAVAIAQSGRRGEVRFYGMISSQPDAVAKLVKTLAARHARLAFAYEAGPTGYGLLRQLTTTGHPLPVGRALADAHAPWRSDQD